MSFKTFRGDESLYNEKIQFDDLADEEEGPELVFKNIHPDCWGNLPVSLFWEEKIVLLIKMYQFLGFSLMVFFEVWPNQYQELSNYFCFLTLNFYMVGFG